MPSNEVLMNASEPPSILAETITTSQLRDLFSFCVGNRTFAVFADEVEGTATSKRPAPLPHAPAGVLGVVCARGCMFTLLDPIALVTGERFNWPSVVPAVVSLRSDEQLALAAESIAETFTVAAADIEAAADGEEDGAANIVVGILRHAGDEITILNTGNLFKAAIRRKERRRRRF